MTTKRLQHQNQYMRQHGRGLASSLCIGRGWDGVACGVCGLGESSGPVLAGMREWVGSCGGVEERVVEDWMVWVAVLCSGGLLLCDRLPAVLW